MRKHWVHPEYKLGNWAYPARTLPSARNSDSVSWFLTASTIGLLFCLFIFVYPLNKASMPEVFEAAFSAVEGLRAGFPVSKDQFVAQLSIDRKKEFASQVHYVLELIKNTKREPKDATKLAISIVTESYRANYDPLFVASVIKSESTFNRHALSYAGAKGLMQILPGTGKYISAKNQLDWTGSHNLNDPAYNLQIGIAYLKELEDKFNGNREYALIAYNWGPANLSKAVKAGTKIPGSSVNTQRI